MNKTKRTLLLVSGILSLVETFVLLILIFSINSLLDNVVKTIEETSISTQMPYEQITEQELQFIKTFLKSLMIIYAFFTTLAGIFTLISISNPEKFESRRGLYVTGAVFTILSGPISLPSILYYVNFAIKDQIAIQQSPAQPSESKNDYDGIEKKIKLLRELKDREEITKEEFRKRLSDMLDKDK